MIALTLTEIAAVVGGRVSQPEHADLVVSAPAFLDSRQPVRDGLFLAIAGERVDGHDFAAAALSGGAAAVLGSREIAGPAVVVDDVQAAVGLLAAHVLSELRRLPKPPTVIAITGSQGKTSVKDMLAAVLADAGPTVATYGSFNNELGLPLTVLRADPSTEYLVLEMGARGIGHLAELCAIAPPDISVVLNVGRAHLGEFGSQEAIAVAKGELVEALTPSGVAVLNLDDPLVGGMAPRTRGRVTTFGTGSGAELRLERIELDGLSRPSFDLQHGADRVHVTLRLLGEHQAMNAAAAAAAALAAGVGLKQVAESLSAIATLSKWRMELHERPDGLVVINDAYNANPDSVRAALRTLADIGERSGRTTWAVLGEMRELGDTSVEEHAAIGRLARELGIGRVVVVGDGARAIGDADHNAVFAASVTEAARVVRNNVLGTEVVLVKASRAAGLERVAEALMADDEVKEAGP